MIEHTQQRTIQEVQQIARDYASYSQSKNGLGTVYGGIIGIAVYLVNLLLGPNSITTIVTIGLTVCWFIGKEVIRQRMYRPLGKAQEIWPTKRRRYHLACVIFVSVVFLGVWIFFLHKVFFSPWGWFIALFAVLFLIISPLIMWRYLRTSDEFTIGVFLLCACMVTAVGSAYQPDSIEGALGMLFFPLVGLCMIYKGFKEHFAFHTLVTASLSTEIQHEHD